MRVRRIGRKLKPPCSISRQRAKPPSAGSRCGPYIWDVSRQSSRDKDHCSPFDSVAAEKGYRPKNNGSRRGTEEAGSCSSHQTRLCLGISLTKANLWSEVPVHVSEPEDDASSWRSETTHEPVPGDRETAHTSGAVVAGE